MAEMSGIEETTILEALEKLGYTHSTVILIPLAPLVDLAWSDGSASFAEREWIFAFARKWGVGEGTPAWRQLEAWLDHCPSHEFFEKTWQALKAKLDALPPEERKATREALLQAGADFAKATGQRLAWASRTSAAKRKLLIEIAARLASPAQAA